MRAKGCCHFVFEFIPDAKRMNNLIRINEMVQTKLYCDDKKAH